ncbi:MAG: PadR family transcriptional regulator [Fusicatenibacter sp.]|nr:PadR family transcriptional regulator [Fusicatenibacter sp.]
MKTDEKKCACKGANLDRFIQPMILLILMNGPDTGYGIYKRVGNFSMFREEKPDVTGVYRYLRVMEKRGILEQFEYKEAENKYKTKYRITEEGKVCLENWKKTLSEYAESILELVACMEKSGS